MAQSVKMVRGTTTAIVVTVRDENGNLYALKDNEKLILGVKSNKNDSKCCIKKIITSGSGEYVFKLSPEDTEELVCGQLCYDVGLQKGRDYYSIVPCSPFVINHNVASREV